MKGTKIGAIEHYYDKIGVAVMKVEKGKIAIGDKIAIYTKSGKKLFEQEIASMQIEGKDVESVKKGDDFGFKVDKKVKQGHEVYKVKE